MLYFRPTHSLSDNGRWLTVAALSDLARPLSSSREWYYAAMRLAIDPFRLLLISLAGWLNQQQQDVIDYLQEENRILT